MIIFNICFQIPIFQVKKYSAHYFDIDARFRRPGLGKKTFYSTNFRSGSYVIFGLKNLKYESKKASFKNVEKKTIISCVYENKKFTDYFSKSRKRALSTYMKQ